MSAQSRFEQPPVWEGPSGDSRDEQFGDVVEGTTLEDADEFDAVLVGEPADNAVIGRRGASEGPRAIREALASTKTHHFGNGPVRSVGDLGDVDIRTADTGRIQATVRKAAAAVHDTAAFPVFVGGDNSLTYGNVAPLLEGGSVGAINLDAHLDVREVLEAPSSGTPYRQLLREGLDAYACVGARHFETSTTYHEFVEDRGGTVLTAERVGEDPAGAADAARRAMGGVEYVYLSLDVDVLDASAAPGVSAPTPGGLTTRECFRLLRRLAAEDRLVGFEVVECAPPLDQDRRTVRAAARAIAHVLSARQAAERAEEGET